MGWLGAIGSSHLARQVQEGVEKTSLAWDGVYFRMKNIGSWNGERVWKGERLSTANWIQTKVLFLPFELCWNKNSCCVGAALLSTSPKHDWVETRIRWRGVMPGKKGTLQSVYTTEHSFLKEAYFNFWNYLCSSKCTFVILQPLDSSADLCRLCADAAQHCIEAIRCDLPKRDSSTAVDGWLILFGA